MKLESKYEIPAETRLPVFSLKGVAELRYYIDYETPVGCIWIVEENGAVTQLSFQPAAKAEQKQTPLLNRAKEQLEEYFTGARQQFDIPLRTNGTAFQEAVWSALRSIPYGETRSYRDIAEAVGNKKAARAVGMANNRNPIAIIIPCHRVIGADGQLVGYGGGLDIKHLLLGLERKYT